MSNFHLIENTLQNSSFPGKDMLLAGGLLGSFVYLSMSLPNKVLVVKPKDQKRKIIKKIKNIFKKIDKKKHHSKRLATETGANEKTSFDFSQSQCLTETNHPNSPLNRKSHPLFASQFKNSRLKTNETEEDLSPVIKTEQNINVTESINLHNRKQSETEIATNKMKKKTTSQFGILAKFQKKHIGRNQFLINPIRLVTQYENKEEEKQKIPSVKIPKTLYQIPVEKPLFSKDDIDFLQKTLEKNQKKDKKVDIKVDESLWEVIEFEKKNFNLEDVYRDFLIDTSPAMIKELLNRKSETKMRKNSLRALPLSHQTSPNKKWTSHLTPNFNISDSISVEHFGSMENIVDTTEILNISNFFHSFMLLETAYSNSNFKKQSYKQNSAIILPEKNLNIEDIHINSFCRFYDNTKINSYVFISSKITFNIPQNILNKMIINSETFNIYLMETNLNAIKINFREIPPKILNLESGILKINASELKIGCNQIEIITIYNNIIFGFQNKIISWTVDFEKLLPKITKNDQYTIELLYEDQYNILSALNETFTINLKEVKEINENIHSKELEKFKLIKFIKTNSINLENSVLNMNFSEEILRKDEFVFFCPKGEKKKLLPKVILIADLLKMTTVFFGNYFKTLSKKNLFLKILYLNMEDDYKSYKGLIIYNINLLNDESKMLKLIFLSMYEMVFQLFMSNEINPYKEKGWLIQGIGLYVLLNFLEKDLLTQSIGLPISHLHLFILSQKLNCIVDDLILGAKILNYDQNIESNRNEFNLKQGGVVFKSLYFFKQLACYIGKIAIHDLLMNLDYKNLNLDSFFESITPFLKVNDLPMFKKWLLRSVNFGNLPELSLEIYNQINRPLFLDELVLTQKNFDNHNVKNYYFIAFLLINSAGMTQFTLDLVVPNLDNCVIDSLKGKYAPKAIICDGDDVGYFLYKFDESSRNFLLKGINRLKNNIHKINAINNFFVEIIRNEINVIDFLEICKFVIEKENDFGIIQYILNIFKKILSFISENKKYGEIICLILSQIKNKFNENEQKIIQDFLFNFDKDFKERIKNFKNKEIEEIFENNEKIYEFYNFIIQNNLEHKELYLCLKCFKTLFNDENKLEIINKINDKILDNFLELLNKNIPISLCILFIKYFFIKKNIEIILKIKKNEEIIEKIMEIKLININLGKVIEKKFEFGRAIIRSLKIPRIIKESF